MKDFNPEILNAIKTRVAQGEDLQAILFETYGDYVVYNQYDLDYMFLNESYSGWFFFKEEAEAKLHAEDDRPSMFRDKAYLTSHKLSELDDKSRAAAVRDLKRYFPSCGLPPHPP